jgi:hypothetical protein
MNFLPAGALVKQIKNEASEQESLVALFHDDVVRWP